MNTKTNFHTRPFDIRVRLKLNSAFNCVGHGLESNATFEPQTRLDYQRSVFIEPKAISWPRSTDSNVPNGK